MKKMIFRVICMGLLFTVSGCGGDKQKIAQLENDVNVLKSGDGEKNQKIARLEYDVKVLKSGETEKNQKIRLQEKISKLI